METYGSLNDKQRKTVKNIETSGRHLLALINDVLDLSKIEAGRLTLEVTRCALEDICQASLQLTKGMAQQRRQRVTYSVPIDPVLVAVDARRIKQVIVNLLSNAIKFTPEDGELGLTVESCGDDRNARVIVWDRGIGIRQENLSRLFQPFVQIDARLSREYTGTGLGLALVKKLLELHEGTVEVESVFGQGSRFIVTLPCVVIPEYPASPSLVASEVENPDPDVSDSSSPFVMVVDDNTLLLEMIADFLEATGYRAVRSQSGKDALEKLGEVAPDIILMDIQMPGMDGLEAIHRIRANPDSMIATIPIIAVTALAMPGDRERCLAAGANDYLTKPVKLMELATILKQLLPGRTAS
jgi:CheY-like chemotaxis protein/anti-sigma regulatory factor (Ser/Thr protein kinase)